MAEDEVIGRIKLLQMRATDGQRSVLYLPEVRIDWLIVDDGVHQAFDVYRSKRRPGDEVLDGVLPAITAYHVEC